VRDGQLGLADQEGFDVVDTDALAVELGTSTPDMFQDDYVHYEAGFAGQLGDALAGNLEFEGDVNLQVGTAGNDSFIVGPGGVQQVFGSAGNDTVDFSSLDNGIRLTAYDRQLAAVENNSGSSEFETNLYQVERIIGTDFDDTFRLGDYVRDVRTGEGDDVVVGGDLGDAIRLGLGDDRALGRDGNDNIQGRGGDDLIAGQNGDDRLFGGAGDDRILAGRGDDLIRGGRGDDEIRPHQGEDTIVYTNGNNGADTIFGFSARDDVLSFEGTGTVLDDLFLSIEESDLRIQVETDSVTADIRIVNGAKFFADENDLETPDWVVV
jgi:Ca2+-binding RTX toxin-like protein